MNSTGDTRDYGRGQLAKERDIFGAPVENTEQSPIINKPSRNKDNAARIYHSIELPQNKHRPKMAATLTAKESAKQLQTLIEDQRKMFGLDDKPRNAASNDNLDEIVRIRPSESMEKIATKQDTERSGLVDKYQTSIEQRL